MKLSTRVTVLLVAITTLVALSVGWFAVTSSTKSDVASLDATINAVVASGQGHPLTALSSALNTVQQNNYDLTLDVIDATGHVTRITSSEGDLTLTPTLNDVHNSLKGVRSSGDLGGFRYRSLDVGGGDFLLIAASTAQVTSHRNQLLVSTLLVGLAAVLLMGVAARLLMRRDLRTINRLIHFATTVAGGTLNTPVPAAEGSTDIRELRGALDQMVATLERTIATEKRVARATQQFIGDASHELRTPLTVIRGYSDLLDGANVDETQRARALERIRREVARMESLVSDLLFLAEVAELPSPPATPVHLSALLAERVKDFETDNPLRPVTTSIDPDVFVAGRLDFLERIVANALNNIARHTNERDAVRVSLATAGGRVALAFDDAGPGLPDDAYGVAPERFHRFSDDRSRATGGSGLGLSIMADVARAMGATMTTERSDLGGLRLAFSFPAVEVSPR